MNNSYIYPDVNLLSESYETVQIGKHTDNPKKIVEFFSSNGIAVNVTDVFEGPLVTEYAFTIARGVRVKSVLSLREDLMRCLEYDNLNFEFPVLGEAKIGINVPSDKRYVLPLRDVIESKWFRQTKRTAAFIIGKNRQNQTVMGDVADWPNMLIGGTTGSGKTSFVDSIILSMVYKYSPNELQFIMIDSLGTNYTIYDDLPHMAIPAIIDTGLTFQIFGWLKKKMRKRFVEFSKYGVRSLQSYNTTMEKIGGRKLPSIVLIIDDIGTFFKRAPKKTRQDITEITLLARAAGIYLIVVSQSASSLILNSDIKSNLCGRFAFKVNNMTESRTIMESEGAEKLLGVGECYYDHTGRHRLGYAQVPYVSHEDISKVVSYVADRNRGKFTSEVDVGEVMREVTGSLF